MNNAQIENGIALTGLQAARLTIAEQAEQIAALLEVLKNTRIALTFYRDRMQVAEKKKVNYPFGNEAEEAARAAIEAAEGKQVQP
jgi:hypothetical protein